MDLDDAEENIQMTGDNEGSDDESVLSYTSQSQFSTPVPSSEPAGAVSPMSTSSSNVIIAFSESSNGEKEKPKKMTVTSAISRALKISAEEKKFRREDDRAAAIRSQDEAYRKHQDAKKKLRERELARERQQKRRMKLKIDDILSGARSPGGTKRKVGRH